MLLDMAAGGTPPVGRAAYYERLKGLLSGATLIWDNCVTDDVAVAGNLAFHRYTGVLWVEPKQGGDVRRNDQRYTVRPPNIRLRVCCSFCGRTFLNR
jgi:hypothetical protein